MNLFIYLFYRNFGLLYIRSSIWHLLNPYWLPFYLEISGKGAITVFELGLKDFFKLGKEVNCASVHNVQDPSRSLKSPFYIYCLPFIGRWDFFSGTWWLSYHSVTILLFRVILSGREWFYMMALRFAMIRHDESLGREQFVMMTSWVRNGLRRLRTVGPSFYSRYEDLSI